MALVHGMQQHPRASAMFVMFEESVTTEDDEAVRHPREHVDKLMSGAKRSHRGGHSGGETSTSSPSVRGCGSPSKCGGESNDSRGGNKRRKRARQSSRGQRRSHSGRSYQRRYASPNTTRKDLISVADLPYAFNR